MNARDRLTAAGIATAAFALVLAGCGGTTVEGSAPEVASEPPQTSAEPTDEAFAQEHVERPTAPVSPPPPESEPEPAPVRDPAEPPPEPEDDPAPEQGEGEAPEPLPGTGDFVALLDRQELALPDGVDPVATATEACGRFDDDQTMVDVSGWLGEHGQLDQEQQGYFLGAAVGTYCPENFPKLG